MASFQGLHVGPGNEARNGLQLYTSLSHTSHTESRIWCSFKKYIDCSCVKYGCTTEGFTLLSMHVVCCVECDKRSALIVCLCCLHRTMNTISSDCRSHHCVSQHGNKQLLQHYLVVPDRACIQHAILGLAKINFTTKQFMNLHTHTHRYNNNRSKTCRSCIFLSFVSRLDGWISSVHL